MGIDTSLNSTSLAQLAQYARNAPPDHAKTMREIAQKECEADLKAHDALIARGNALLAASGVALSLLVGFVAGLARETVINSGGRKVLLVLALISAAVAVFFVVLSMLLYGVETQFSNANIAGKRVTEKSDQTLWKRDHEMSMTLAYFEIRMNLSARHRRRACLLATAQWCYLVFLVLICTLGITVVV